MVFTHMNTIHTHLENTSSPSPGPDSKFPRGEHLLNQSQARATSHTRPLRSEKSSATNRVVQVETDQLQMFSVSRCISVIQSCQPDKSDQDCLGIKTKAHINK